MNPQLSHDELVARTRATIMMLQQMGSQLGSQMASTQNLLLRNQRPSVIKFGALTD